MKRFDSVSTAGGGKLSYPRLMITPLGVLPLLLSVVAALASGFLMLFSPASETASSLAIIDIAAACAFIALFGYLFGIWVGTKAALMVTQALLYMTDDSGRRLDKLAGKLARELEKPRCELSEVAETSDSFRSLSCRLSCCRWDFGILFRIYSIYFPLVHCGAASVHICRHPARHNTRSIHTIAVRLSCCIGAGAMSG